MVLHHQKGKHECDDSRKIDQHILPVKVPVRDQGLPHFDQDAVSPGQKEYFEIRDFLPAGHIVTETQQPGQKSKEEEVEGLIGKQVSEEPVEARQFKKM